MVAEEKYRANSIDGEAAQPIEHLGRMRPTIDEVAKEDEQSLPSGPLTSIPVDIREELVEQIEPAVHVADRVRAVTPCSPGLRLASAHEVEDRHSGLKRKSASLDPVR
jgi:hypothetical protein